MNGFPVAPPADAHGFFFRPSKVIGKGGEAAAQPVQTDFRQAVSGSKAETGKASETHTGVNTWRYFVNPILYMERSGSEMIPYTVSIDVKQKDNGNFVYSFHAERDVKNNGQPAPQTLHAAVNGAENDTANGLPIKESIADTANASALTQTPEAPAGTASFDPTIRSNSGKSQEKSSGRASIVVLPDGKKYVQADRQVIFGNDPASWADQIEGYINRKIRNGEDVILTTDSGDVLKITEDTAGKAAFRNYIPGENGTMRRMSDSEYEAKLNAEAHIDELAQISRKNNQNPVADEIGTNDKLIHGDLAKNGWYYRTAWFSDFDGQYYRVTISTADGANGVVVYNVGKIEKRTSPTKIRGSSDSVSETGARQGKPSSTANIRQTEGNSQEKSSGRASVEVEDQSEADKRREWFRKMAQQDRQEAARLMRKDETLARANRGYGRPAPDKGAGQVYRAERDHGPDAGDSKRYVVVEKQPVDTRTLRIPDLLTSFREPRIIPAVRNGTLSIPFPTAPPPT